jgi:hypothetical protein
MGTPAARCQRRRLSQHLLSTSCFTALLGMNLPYYNVTMFKLLVTSLFLFTALNPFLLLLLCYTFARRCLSLRGLAPTEAVVIRSEAERPREQGPVGPSDRVAGSRTRTWEQSQLPGAGPHQDEHTHRHQTAVFRSGETCLKVGCCLLLQHLLQSCSRRE